jgi:diphthamide biosynthesis enzyme Dph1/Dph2-like protein
MKLQGVGSTCSSGYTSHPFKSVCHDMIVHNAVVRRYDPYAREMTVERYDQEGMRAGRRRAVEAAAPARQWGIVLGTLGRQVGRS